MCAEPSNRIGLVMISRDDPKKMIVTYRSQSQCLPGGTLFFLSEKQLEEALCAVLFNEINAEKWEEDRLPEFSAEDVDWAWNIHSSKAIQDYQTGKYVTSMECKNGLTLEVHHSELI